MGNAEAQQGSQLPQAAPSSPGQDRMKPHIKLILIAQAGLLLVAAGAFAYWQSARPSPDSVMDEMAKRMAEVKSVEYRGTIEATGNSAVPVGLIVPSGVPAGPGKDVSITMSGAMDWTDPENRKSMNRTIMPLGQQGELTTETRTIGNVTYMKTSGLEKALSVPSPAEDKWIKIDFDEMLGKYAEKSTAKDVAEAKKAFDSLEITGEKAREMQRALADARIFRITETLGKERIAGKKALHYKFEIDPDRLSVFMTKAYEIWLGEKFEEPGQASPMFERAGFMGGEMWIYEDSRLMARMSLVLEMEPDERGSFAERIEIDMEFTNYDKPVSIEAPAGAKTMEELISEMVSGLREQSARESGRIEIPRY